MRFAACTDTCVLVGYHWPQVQEQQDRTVVGEGAVGASAMVAVVMVVVEQW